MYNLYDSTEKAFPNTKLRQHATDTIEIKKIHFMPFVGTHTFFIKGEAFNIENNHEYNPIILFKKVIYHTNDKENLTKIHMDNKDYFFENIYDNDVLVRCQCKDFFWRGNYPDFLDHSLWGKVRKKYESQGGLPANPTNAPLICKHIIKLAKVLSNSGLFNIRN